MDRNAIQIEVIGRKIILRMSKSEADIHFVRTLQYSRWNKDGFFWEIPHYPGNLERVEQGKGKKDRYTLLSKKTLEILRVYIKKERPHFYLFEGQGSESQKPIPYSARSTQSILNNFLKKTTLKKK